MKLKTENSKLNTLLTIALVLQFALRTLHSQTNLVVATARAVMVNSNGVLLAPTNFFATNKALINAIISGGGGYSLSSNLIPTNAVFDAGTNASDPFGVPSYKLPALATNCLYYVKYLGTNGEYVADSEPAIFLQTTPRFGNNGYSSGLFSVAAGGDGQATSPTAPYFIIAYDNASYAAGLPVDVQVFAVTTNVQAGTFAGSFEGTVSDGSVVNDAALSPNIQRKNATFYAVVSNADVECKIVNETTAANPASGSAFTIDVEGSVGYADLNFEDHGSKRCCLGNGNHLVNEFPYNAWYLELVSTNAQVVKAGVGILSEWNNTDFGWRMFWNRMSDTDYSTTAFVFNRSAGQNCTNIAMNVPLVISNTASAVGAPAAAILGTNKSVGLWVSNGVLYARTSSDGSTFADKQLAP